MIASLSILQRWYPLATEKWTHKKIAMHDSVNNPWIASHTNHISV